MGRLIMKDIYLQKSSIRFMLIYLVIVIVLMDSYPMDGKYFVFIITIAYAFSIIAFAYDEKAKGEIVINSLPVSRKDVVLSKYISFFAYTFAITVVCALVGIILNILKFPVNISVMKLTVIKPLITAAIILSSINFPFYFRFGYQKGRLVSTITFMAVFIGSMTFFNAAENKKCSLSGILSGSKPVLDIIWFAVLGVIFAISIMLSTAAYEKRDL